MIDVKKADRKALAKCLVNPSRLWVLLVGGALFWVFAQTNSTLVGLGIFAASAIVYGCTISQDFKVARWKNQDHLMMWSQIVERWRRLKRAMKKAPEFARDSLSGVMHNIERTANQLHHSLRTADLVKAEILRSEENLSDPRLRLGMRTGDVETSQLYSIADKNVAEYRKLYEIVASRVTRVEAQCAVFSSAMDALRIKLLGYRLVSKAQSEPTKEFSHAVLEIKNQLSGIDEALKELELYPEIRIEES